MACSRTLQATFIFLAAAAAISSLQSENSENSFPAAEAAANIIRTDRQLGEDAVATYNRETLGVDLITFCDVIGKSDFGNGTLILIILVQRVEAPPEQLRQAEAVLEYMLRTAEFVRV